jgi:hypothetical protein
MRTREICCTIFSLACIIYAAMVVTLAMVERCSICKSDRKIREIRPLRFSERNRHSLSLYDQKKNDSAGRQKTTSGGQVFLGNITGLHEDIKSSALAKTTAVERSAGLAKPRNAPRLLYFAITHHKGLPKAIASEDTWGRHVNRGKGILWYTSQYEPLLRWQHVLSNRGGYWNITYRVLSVYRHVFRHHRGYDWYALFWDDNYVFVENFEVNPVFFIYIHIFITFVFSEDELRHLCW